MSFFYSDDPVRDAERHCVEQDKRLEELPKCSICDNPIQDEHLYLINDEFVCPECLERDFRKSVDDCIR